MEDNIINQEQNNLHAVRRCEISPGISLTCIKTEMFKTGCLTINFLTPLSRENASASALLPRVLRRGSRALQNMEQISAALDELYGARVEPLVRKKGEIHCIGFYADFIDDRYLPGEQRLLEKTAEVLGDLLVSPYMPDGLLHAEYVESEKANLIDDIHAAINDKRGYAIDRLLDEMCPDEPYGVSRLGSEQSASAITPQSLTEHYNKIISDSKVEVYYCGSAEPERVIEALRPALNKLAARGSAEIPQTKIILNPRDGSPKHFTEKLDVSQGKLTIGFRLGSAMENPDYPALIVFNSIFGGSVTSKLFLNVREKLSLCYYASSMLDKHKGIMLVASGVEFDKFETAYDEILHQLGEIKKGEISEWEFTSAKRFVVTSIKSALDRLGGLEELYFDSSIAAVPYDPVEICDLVEQVTLERILAIASGIEPELVYFLTGEGGGKNEA